MPPDTAPLTGPICGTARRAFSAVFVSLALTLGLAPTTVMAQTATSDQITGVVELFTSQGCVSCPPADTILKRYADRPDVLALSYHVDYWDYIGWHDALASPQNAERQRAYSEAFDRRMIYTPQFIVNGTREIAGARSAEVAQAVEEQQLPMPQADTRLTLSVDEETLRISAAGDPNANEDEGDAVLILVTFRDETHTHVQRGENKGLDLVNHHSVRDWRMLGKLTRRPVEMEMPLSTMTDSDGSTAGCAVFLQRMDESGRLGPILAAAVLPLKS